MAEGPTGYEEGNAEMLSNISVLLGRAKDVLQKEGLIPVLRRGFALVASQFFQYDNFYLYEHKLQERNEADFMPKIKDFTFKIVHNNEEADELAKTIGVDFRKRFVDSRQRLEKGAIAFCVFVDGEIAHVGWVALNEEARGVVDDLPYKIDFSNGEACTGGTGTALEYRGNGLMVYGYFKRFQFLREKGFTVSRNAVTKSNLASQKAHSKFGPKIYAEARYFKLLWWKFWEEKPISQAEHRS